MHEKAKQLFTQKTQRQEEIRQNKLPLQLSSLDPEYPEYLNSIVSRTLIVTFNFLFFIFDCHFYYFL